MIPHKFPGFKPQETEILKRFLGKQIITGDYDYNVRLPWSPPPNFEQLKSYEQKMLESVHQRRIDAVCTTKNYAYLIEVKIRANTQAIGELATYDTLYRKLPGPSRTIKKVLVAEESNRDIELVLKQQDIKLYIV